MIRLFIKKAAGFIYTAAFSLTAALTAFPTSFSASAESFTFEGFTLSYTVSSGSACITSFSGSGSDLEIPNSFGDIPVNSIAASAFKDCDCLYTLTLPSSLTFIGNKAFADCSSLRDVVIPDSVITIGESAFMNCSSLYSADLGSGLKNLGTFAFAACPKLSTISVDPSNPYFSSDYRMLLASSGTKLVQYAGLGGNVSIPDTVSFIGNAAFFGLNTVTSVNIPSSVHTIGAYAFSGCSSLTSISIPNSVTSLGSGCFMSCNALQSASIGSGIASVPNEAFSLCPSLQSVSIPNSVSAIRNNAFFDCVSLSDIDIPDSVSYIGSCALGFTYDLRSNSNVTLDNFFISGKTSSAAQNYANTVGITFIDYDKLIKGDANNDSVVDAVDASSVLSEYANISTGGSLSFKKYQSFAADIDSSGSVDAIDASLILSKYSQSSL